MSKINDNLDIVFENDDYIVCNKPKGLLSQPDEKNTISLLSVLNDYLKPKGNKAILIHRLDRGVGGLIVYAITDKASVSLNKQIQQGLFEKEYVATVHGNVENDSGIYEDFLFKDAVKKKSYVVKTERKGSKKAILCYSVTDRFSNDKGSFTTLRIKLKTGRFHQIRCQLAYHGNPIVGDGKYGSKVNVGSIMLECKYLSFISPTDKRKVFYELN